MRLDAYLSSEGAVRSRNKAQELIRRGMVFVNGEKITKPAYELKSGSKIVIKDDTRFVGRGGLKLERAISGFGIDVRGKRCADIGASTGGFTDCLLQNGAAEVYSIDSGHGQLDEKLKSDPRVKNTEGFNARNLSRADFGVFDLVVMDVSFISQTLIYPAVEDILAPGGVFVSLIKPQFEAGRENIGKNGIVKNLQVHVRCIELVRMKAMMHGLAMRGLVRSPVDGSDGNREYLAFFVKGGEADTSKNTDAERVVFEK